MYRNNLHYYLKIQLIKLKVLIKEIKQRICGCNIFGYNRTMYSIIIINSYSFNLVLKTKV